MMSTSSLLLSLSSKVGRRFVLMLKSRQFGEEASTKGKVLETMFEKIKKHPDGQVAIETYGNCLDRQLNDVTKGCCDLEFRALKNILKLVLEEEKHLDKVLKKTT